ncbi:MAG: autotransporter-associated beta strand repeat protein [Verrucomicrobiales bacterium]|nr:autotransporter-associated beta strand repeat protein [Verrucomicrobiales bacterium]
MKRSSSATIHTFLLCFGLFIAAFSVAAEENHWTGNASNGLWSDSINWSLDHAPTPSEDVILNGNSDQTIVVNSSTQINLFQLGGGTGKQTLVVTNCNFQFYHGVCASNSILNLAGTGTVVSSEILTNQGIILGSNGTNKFSILNYFGSGHFQADSNANLILYFTQGVLEDGTSFDGLGVVEFFFDTRVSCRGNMYVNGSFTFDGEVFGTNTWHGPGTFNWTKGQFRQGEARLASDLPVNALGPYVQLGRSGRLTNDAVMQWWDGDPFDGSTPDAFFENRGMMILHTNCTMNSMVFINTGTIKVLTGTKTLSFSNMPNYTYTAFINSGALQVATNATLLLDSADTTLKEGTVFGPGTTEMSSGTVINGEGNIFINGPVKFSGALKGTNTWHGPGTFILDGARLLSGNITFPADLPVNAGSFQVYDGAHLTNRTTLELLTNSFSFENGGSIENFGYISVANCAFGNGGSIENFGYISATNCDFSGTAVHNFTTLFCAGETTFGSFHNYGTCFLVEGTATLYSADYNFSNSGTLDVRQGSVALYCSGGFTPPQPVPPMGTCKLSFGGVRPIFDYPQFTFVGFTAGDFPGTIVASLTNNFVVTNGTAFTLINGNTPFSSFPSGNNLQLPPLSSNLNWRSISSNGNEFTVRAVSPTVVGNATRLTNGAFAFLISGGSGSSGSVELSTNLTDWFSLQSTSPYTGTLSVVDPSATNASQRFYRFRIDD